MTPSMTIFSIVDVRRMLSQEAAFGSGRSRFCLAGHPVRAEVSETLTPGASPPTPLPRKLNIPLFFLQNLAQCHDAESHLEPSQLSPGRAHLCHGHRSGNCDEI